MPGGVPELARALLWFELAIVLLVSLGRSAVYSVVSIVSALTAPGPLSSQAANLNSSLAPDRPWLDLTYQLLRIGFALVPVGLAAYLLVRSGTRVRDVWARGGRWATWGDLGRGAWLALGVGTVGVVFYLATFALGTNLTVVAQSLPSEWWQVPVLVLAAAENAVLEELVVLGFVQVRLRQLGFGDSAAIGLAALLRGSYHLYQGLGGFVGNLAMGLLFGWLFRRWGRVMPFVVAHTLLDVGAFVGYAALAGPGRLAADPLVPAPREPAAAPQRPEHQHRLEEQPDEPGPVGVQPEGVDALDVLRDVAREDRHEERGEQPADEPLLLRQGDERRAEPDLDDPGRDDGEVLVEREPRGHLRPELLALGRQVEHTGAHHRGAEQETGGGAGLLRVQPRSPPRVVLGPRERRPIAGERTTQQDRGQRRTSPGFISPAGSSASLTARISDDLDVALVRRSGGRLPGAEPVLGADAAAELGDEVVHDPRTARRRCARNSSAVSARRRLRL